MAGHSPPRAPGGQRRLIITADDFGLHPAVNAAVEAASRGGVLTAASLMMAAPATAEAVRLAHRLPHLKIGLHVVLADGWATLPRERIPALVDARGRFGDRLWFDALRYAAIPRVRRQLESEIRAQFDAFAATGLTLDHVNVHKHLQLHPVVLDTLLRVGADHGLSAMRLPDEPGSVAWALLTPWLMLMQRRLRAAGVLHNDRVFGIAHSGRMTEDRLLALLARLPVGITEIYLHPATGPLGLASMHGYRPAEELAALTSSRVRAALEASDIVRCGYGDLRPMSATPAPRRAAQPCT
jgi:hopanoid biosynthesis associated protein HpnK